MNTMSPPGELTAILPGAYLHYRGPERARSRSTRIDEPHDHPSGERMKRQVAVQIAGQRYVLRSDDGDEDSVREVAAYVDARIRELQRQGRTADTQALATLAALQIAEELFGERRATSELKKKIREKGRQLLQFLEREARL
jgi:cell division protein ZapA